MKNIILPDVLCGYESRSVTLREKHNERMGTEHSGEYLDLRRRKWQEVGQDCIMRSFISCVRFTKCYLGESDGR
jgi:hypothetical protein